MLFGKERAQRRISLRKGSKSAKKSPSSNSSVITTSLNLSPVAADISPLVLPCDTIVVTVDPAVTEETTPALPSLVDQVNDLSPQKAVEDISIDMNQLIDELLETPKENDEQTKEQVELSDDEHIEEEVDIEEEDVIEQVDDVTNNEGNWTSFMNLFAGSWRSNNNDNTLERRVNVNDYRIQGIAFQNKLDQLEAMGFTDRSRNMILLAKNLANLERTVEDLTA